MTLDDYQRAAVPRIIRRGLAAGMKPRDIADRYPVNVRDVWAARPVVAAELMAAGATAREAAKAVGVPRQMVYRWRCEGRMGGRG